MIKVVKYWTKEARYCFLEIYSVIKQGKPFKPGNVDDVRFRYPLMMAFELRNLGLVKQLKAPNPENVTGWFKMAKTEGTSLWKTPLYGEHPFSITFRQLIKTAFHLVVDEIENIVRKFGVEHRYVSIRSHLGELCSINYAAMGILPMYISLCKVINP